MRPGFVTRVVSTELIWRTVYALCCHSVQKFNVEIGIEFNSKKMTYSGQFCASVFEKFLFMSDGAWAFSEQLYSDGCFE